MGGTRAGGLKAQATNKQRYGEDFYKHIGHMGGKLSHAGGFKDRELARRAGKIGGMKSRRGKAKARVDNSATISAP